MKILFSFLFAIICVVSYAQINLVPNPSFEEYLECPNEVGEFDGFLRQWQVYRNTPDYFNRCSVDTFVTVPCNRLGCQEPATGEGHAGVYGLGIADSYREVIGIQLTEALITGQTYYVSFKASPGYGRYIGMKWFSNKLGVKFSMTEYDVNNPAPIDNFSHIYSEQIISDTSAWTTVYGSFITDTSYRYIMLGNFFDNDHTDTLTNNEFNTLGAYYYIDDVCVTTIPEGCNFISSISEMIKKNIAVYPNPATDVLHVKYSGTSNLDISIFNIMGESIVANVSYSNNIFMVDVSNISSGTYFLKIRDKSTSISKKIFINH